MPTKHNASKRTAFNWRAYTSRGDGLRLLRAQKIHVDTLLTTRDGFYDTVHWQVINALCPRLFEAAQLVDKDATRGPFTWRHLRLPERVSQLLASQLVQCAYGERISLDRRSLNELYLLSVDFGIKHVIELCLRYAQRFLDAHNCIQLLLLGIKHGHHELRRAAYSMVRSNFKLVLHVNCNLHLLPADQLRRLLLDDSLKLNEDEELAWLAILRWLDRSGKLGQAQLLSMYNRMVSQVEPCRLAWTDRPSSVRSLFRLHQPRVFLDRAGAGTGTSQQSSLTYYSPPVPFDSVDAGSEQSSSRPQLIGSSQDFATPVGRKEDQLLSLLRCLRFMRFRSLNAFEVILSNEAVQADSRLSLLVHHMKLRYMIRKRMPLDKDWLKCIQADEHCLEEIMLSEATQPRRAIKYLSRLVKFRPVRPTSAASQVAAKPGDKLERPEAVPAATLSQLGTDCLRRADRPRVPNSVAFLIGGWQDGAVCSSVLSYDFVCDKWLKLSIRLPEPRAFHASCSSANTGQIYIFGGTNGEQILSSVLRFEPAGVRARCEACRASPLRPPPRCSQCRQPEYVIRNMSPMRERRCHLSGVLHSDGRLYALGGHDGQQRLRSAELLELRAGRRWQPIADMTIARSDAAACSHDNKIFVAGGQIGDQFIQSSVEFYKASDNTWTFATPMIVPRMAFQLVSFKSQLLAIGGTNGLMGGDEVSSVTRSVERYNPNLTTWSLCAPMTHKRSSFGAAPIEGQLIVCGGHSGRRRLKACESLRLGRFIEPAQPVEPEQQVRSHIPPMPHLQPPPASGVSALRTAMRWFERANLPTRRSGFSVSVVGQLKNAREFTYHGCERPSAIKQRTRWHRLKIIKRRKLVRNLKIALVVTVVILIM